MEAIVLAGGLGTRLRPLVQEVPKPMAPVHGRPFLEWLIEYWIGQGVRRFVISTGHLAEHIAGHFGASWGSAEIECVREPEPLGTGGGTLLALEATTSADVLVLNGDTFFAVELPQFASQHRQRAADCSVSLHRCADSVRYLGIGLGPHAEVQALGVPSGDRPALVNGGVYLFRTEILRALPWRAGMHLSLESDLLPYALNSGWRMLGWECEGTFIDIGVPQDYARAQEIFHHAADFLGSSRP